MDKKKYNKYLDEEQPITDEDMEQIEKRADFAGKALLTTGAVVAPFAYSKKLRDARKIKVGKKVFKYPGVDFKGSEKIAKYGTAGTLAAGAALVGYSHYKKHKRKKNEEKKDDNSKK